MIRDLGQGSLGTNMEALDRLVDLITPGIRGWKQILFIRLEMAAWEWYTCQVLE